MSKYCNLLCSMALILGCLILGLCSVEARAVEIFYADAEGELCSEIQQIAEAENLYEVIGRALLHGPTTPTFHSAIPTGTRIYSVSYADNVLYIDFSRDLFSYQGGTHRERLILGQIIYTFTQFPHIHFVQLEIEGQKVLAPEGSLTDQPLSREAVGLGIKRRQR